MSTPPYDCLIGFGSNLGDRREAWHYTLEQLTEGACDGAIESSPLLETTPVGASDSTPPAYLNAVIRLRSELKAIDLWRYLSEIEYRLGRRRTTRWGPRTVDLDLLLHNRSVIESDELEVPHPRLTFRRFVLEPAQSIAGDMQHPLARQSLSELLAILNQRPNRIVLCRFDPNQLEAIRAQLHLPSGTAVEWPDSPSPTASKSGPGGRAQPIADTVSWQFVLVNNSKALRDELASAKLVVYWRDDVTTEEATPRDVKPEQAETASASPPIGPSNDLDEPVARVDAAELAKMARYCPGPTLPLRQCDPRLVAQELSAAIQTMTGL